MKLRLIANVASVAALAAVLPLGSSSARAVSSGTAGIDGGSVTQTSQVQPVAWEKEKREKLRYAYYLLENADRDYHGHRGAAMEHIKKAADIIGEDIHHHEGSWGKPQGESDAHLREARRLLTTVSEESGGKEFEHVRSAIHELDRALEIH
jgi:hypothetical protein